ncbi:MAG: carboxyl transferase domain-containing protein [Nocardioides sp.]|uniref:acyl-CoA carboxylase subunit beta n=1 Tax=Nocardioides sp. TaxID=35761 RepID=UPI0039E4DAA5
MTSEASETREQADPQPLIARLRLRADELSDESRAEAVAVQHAKGKLTARERIALLTGGDFQEFGRFAGPGPVQPGSPPLIAPGDGVVTGVGRVDGRPVAIASFDFTVLGGSNGAIGMSKLERCVERCLVDRIPLVMLMDGGGHRMQEGLDSRLAGPGSRLLTRLVDLSGWVPTVSVFMGPGFGASANLAALCDFVVVLRGHGLIGMSAASFVRAATGEETTNEALAGADAQAARGVADIAADDEQEALDAARAYLSFLPSYADGEPLRARGPHAAPDVDVDALVPASMRRAYDVRDVIEALCDDSSVFELRPTAAANIVTAFGRIHGHAVGFVANQPLHLGGALDSPACEKAAHFVAVCDTFGIPLVTLIDLPGFLIGTAAEEQQLVRRSGRLAFELGQVTVPRFSIVVRKAYGAAYIVMGGGRSIEADLSLAWPTAEICAMPIESAVDIAYRRDYEAAPDPAARRAELVDTFRANVDPYQAADGFGIDDVVAPSETRALLAEALERIPRRRPSRVPEKRRTVSPI